MRRALLLLFFLTGATALGYQLVWTRMFANGLGHEMPAVLAVVAAFMAGMALGARVLGTAIARSVHPGRWYAALELVVGVWGALSCIVIPLANRVGIAWIGFGSPRSDSGRQWQATFILTFIALLPATMAMGASFPAMARLLPGRSIGALYASNTLGAMAGILGMVWWLMPAVGLRASAMALAGMNLSVAIGAWLVARAPLTVEVETEATITRRHFVTVFITGLLAIGYEVVGVRVLSQVMENTVYSFAAALAVYLLGTALGAAWYQRFGGQRSLESLLCGSSLACLAGVWIMSKAQVIYDALRNSMGDSTANVMLAEMLLACAVFLAPTFFMGAIFSLLLQTSGQRLSRLFAVNTLGSALAPVVFGVLLLPLLGSKWALSIILFSYFLLVARWTRWRLAFPLMAVAGLLALPAHLRIIQVPPGGSLVEYREGTMASVAVVQDAAGDKTLTVNNRFQMGGTAAAAAEYRQAHLPLLLHPNPRQLLFLGIGTGITLGATALHPGIWGRGVELLPEVYKMIPHFKPHNFLPDDGMGWGFENSALRAQVGDARRFIQAAFRFDYDVIIADLFHPARDGAGTLYTKEHFAAVRARLDEDGLFCQWLPLHQMDETMLRVVIRTFLEVFPKAQAYLLHWNVDVPVMGLFGANSWPAYTNGWVEARAKSGPLQTQLKRLGIADSTRVFGHFLAGAEELRNFAGNAPINTDDRQIVTYGAPRFSYQRRPTSYGRLLALLEIAKPRNDFIRARNVYLYGLVDETEGRMEQAIDRYIESARISADFTLGYARCLTLVALQAKDRPGEARALLERLAEAQPGQAVAREMLERLFPPLKN